MFEAVQPAPRDPILGLFEAFRQDPSARKVNLGVGIYQEADGSTPVLRCVREAELLVTAAQAPKTYLPIEGTPAYRAAVGKLLFGEAADSLAERCFTAHTPGGTGALRVAADLLHENFPKATVWLTQPTWPNHPAVFSAAGVPTKTFPYFDAAANGLAFEAALAAIEKIPAGDVLLLHGCCHNPTGVDPSPEQWRQLIQMAVRRGVLPLLDFAYQGFAEEIEADAEPVRILLEHADEFIVCSSFSKNFGLYSERVGALTIVARDAKQMQTVASQVKQCVRRNYSNPPQHGAALVTTVLEDESLRTLWREEVGHMRDRINGMRKLWVETMAARGVEKDFSFLTRQRGMFSLTGLTPEQVEAVRERRSVYIVGSGRINIAGVSEANIGQIADALADVV